MIFNGIITPKDMEQKDHLKKELLYRLPTYKMKMTEVKSWIFRYVFGYYNTVRIYTSNPYGLPPAAYRKTLLDEALAA